MSLLSNPEIAEKLQRINENTRWRKELKASGIDTSEIIEVTIPGGVKLWTTRKDWEEREKFNQERRESYRFHMLNFATSGTT